MSLWDVLRGMISDTEDRRAWLDSASHALETIEIEHFEVHRGDAYTIARFTSVAAGAFYDWEFTTPNTAKWLHMFFDIEVEAESEISVYEDADLGVGGVDGAYNRNRNSANVTGATIKINPAINALGTLLWSWKLGSGKKFGGESRERNEFVMKQDTTYLFRVKNTSASPGWVSVQFHWYELTNKD